ncbi:MAG TPA: hypothetical protein VGL77_04895, partial [Armatimonadota bacterium]
ALCEVAGASVKMNPVLGSASVTRRGGTNPAVFVPFETQATVAGKPVPLPLAPFAAHGVVYVPVLPLLSAWNGTAALDKDLGVMTLTLPGRNADQPTVLALPFSYQAGMPMQYTDTDTELYVVNLDGSNQRRLTFNTGDDALPAFSPDGRKIVFTRNGTLIARPLYGRQETELPRPDVTDPDLATSLYYPLGFAAGGAEIIFVRNPPRSNAKTSEIFSTRVDDTGAVKSLGKGNLASVSPNGKYIAFISRGDTPGHMKVNVMNADGSNLRVIDAAGGWRMSPLFSPDSTKLLYNHADLTPDGKPRMSLALCPLAGDPAPLILTPADQQDMDELDARFSPDGTQIVFMRDKAGIWLTSADGKTRRQLVESAKGLPAFTPDGAGIIYYGDNSLMQVGLDGQNADALTKRIAPTSFAIVPGNQQLLILAVPMP